MKHVPFLWFQNCDGLTLASTNSQRGVIDGQGYMWWLREFLGKNLAHRPKLIEIDYSRNIEIMNLFITNSPSFHIVPNQCENAYFHDFEIYVDIWKQFELGRLFMKDYATKSVNAFELGIDLPMFPLNTDGIDFAGRNATYRRLKITNFDDAIVPKPSNKAKMFSNCTQDILVEDIEVYFSVGMSIGSVPPSDEHNCVKNILFRNIEFFHPLKAIYIKTNPGEGTGEITNITYENIVMTHPIWWGVYIGP